MSLSVIIPDETKMTIPKFEEFGKVLMKFINSNVKDNPKEIEKAIKKISEISGYLIAADKKKFPQYFTKFNEFGFLAIFNSLLDLDISDISFCILEAINFLLLNLKNKDLILTIYKTKFKTKIQGQEMNILDKLMGINLEDKDEFLNHQINFMKSLSLKFDNDNVFYFFNKDVNQFQMLTKSFSMYNNSDPMVRNVVKNILLAIIKIKNKELENFLVSFPINIYYTNLVLNFKNYILQLCLIDLSEVYNDRIYGIFRKKHDELIDISIYLGDILDLGIKPINFMLINCLLNEVILPLFKVIISRNKEMANLPIALYIFTVIIFNMKNKDILSIISYLLFEEKVFQGLLKYVYDYSFKFMNIDYMTKINYIIENCQLADVNDSQWKDISVYMKFVNGIDLSTREVHDKNTYDTIISVIKNNSNNQNIIKNEIFNLTKAILYSNDEYKIMIYNLLILSFIKFYTNEINLDSEEDKIIFNPLLLPFFAKDESSIDNPDGLFQLLIKLIKSENNFRISTYEIIIHNIECLIDIFLSKFKKENSEENPELKTKIKDILISIHDFQIKKIKKLFDTNKHLWKKSYNLMNAAYGQYVKSIDKKINDLITLPHVLVPVNFTNFYEDIPKNLIQNLTPEQIAKSNFIVLMQIHDIIYKLDDNEKEMIKSQRFPLEAKYKYFSNGKTIEKNEIGENYAFCKVIDNGNQNSSLVILTGDSLYLAEITSGNFDDISSVKIIKKILLRNLEIKVSVKDEEILEVADKNSERSNLKYISIHCLNPGNTGKMFNYLSKQKKNCLQAEYTLLNTYLDNLENKFSNKEKPDENKS